MFDRDAARETNVFAMQVASLTTGGTCTVRERALASSSSAVWKRSTPFALQRLPHSIHKGCRIRFTKVQYLSLQLYSS